MIVYCEITQQRQKKINLCSGTCTEDRELIGLSLERALTSVL